MKALDEDRGYFQKGRKPTEEFFNTKLFQQLEKIIVLDDMSKFETVTLPTFGLACIIVAVISLMVFGFANIYSILVGAFLFILGLAALVTWLINRTRRKAHFSESD